MSKYLLLLHGGDFERYSPEEMKEILHKYIAWNNDLKERGIFVASEELKPGGRMLNVKNDQFIDGPFTETKEAVGGFYLIEAENFEQATEVSSGCPHLQFGGSVQLREVNPH